MILPSRTGVYFANTCSSATVPGIAPRRLGIAEDTAPSPRLDIITVITSYICVCTYIYIYIERERERESYLPLSLSLSIYIYICTHIHVYIYIYIYSISIISNSISGSTFCPRGSPCTARADLWTCECSSSASTQAAWNMRPLPSNYGHWKCWNWLQGVFQEAVVNEQLCARPGLSTMIEEDVKPSATDFSRSVVNHPTIPDHEPWTVTSIALITEERPCQVDSSLLPDLGWTWTRSERSRMAFCKKRAGAGRSSQKR